MSYAGDEEHQGCAPSPNVLVGLALVFLWMFWVVPAYRDWRYPRPEPGETAETTEQSAGGDTPRTDAAPADEAGEAEGEGGPDLGRETPADDGAGLVPGQTAAEALAERAADLPEPPAELPGEHAPEEDEPGEAEKPEPKVRVIRVDTDDLIVEFSTLGASIERASLCDYHPTPKDTKPLPILMPLRGASGGASSFVLRPTVDVEGKTRGVDLSEVVWELAGDSGEFDEKDERTLTFTTTRAGVRYRKRFVLRRDGLVFGLEVEATNAGPAAKNVEFDLVGPNGIVPDDVAGGRKYAGMLAVLAGRTGPGEPLNTEKINFRRASKDDLTERDLSMALNEWVAVKNRYFTAVCQAEDAASVTAIYAEAVTPDERFAAVPDFDNELLGQQNVAGVMRVSLGSLQEGQSAAARFEAYLGPTHGEILRAAGGERGWEELVDFGWFGWLSRLLLGLLNILHLFTGLFGKIVGGYGFAILLLTLAVKGAMFPVMRKSMTSMHKMQKLAPEQAAIKKRYEKDKSREAQRRMQMEIMELYKKHGVSPLGGCLPMLIQLPMFFALFGMLRNAFELRQEPYLWIRDLTQPEHVVRFGISVPILGEGLNLLPLVYLGLTFLQQHLQPKPADPQTAQQQKMMRYMLFIFPFILYNMPSGLILYFVFSNALGILEQWIIRRRLDEGPATVPAAGGAVTDGRLVGADTGGRARHKTAWDKEDEREARKTEKRKKKKEQRERMGGPGMM